MVVTFKEPMKANAGVSRIVVHVIVWACFFFYPFIFHYLPLSDPCAVTRVALFLLLEAAFFYFNTGILIPKLLGKKKVILYMLVVAACILVIAAGTVFGQYLFNPDYSKKPWLFSSSINTAIFGSLLVLGISSVVKLTSEWYRNQQVKQEIEHEKVNAELSFLKAQIDPHFLFNSLNSIYALAHKSSEDTEKAILKLADQLRYMLYESPSGFVPLEKEIEYLNNYIDLQKLRLPKNVKINFRVNGETGGRMIEPMLLVPLVENAFKHGITTLTDSFIDIDLELTDAQLYFKVVNSVPPVQEVNIRKHGIGLQNVRRRLDLLYPGKHELRTGKQNEKYIAELIISFSK